MQTHTHTVKIIFLMTTIWDSLALVVNTDTLPACTFLYFFVLSSLKCKIHSLNKRAFYFKKNRFDWNPNYP